MTKHAVDRVRQSFEAVPNSARAARHFVAETLRTNGASAQMIRDYALVVSELATNIIEHGDGSSLVICLDVADPAWWGLEVVGGASAPLAQLLQPDTWTVAAADESSGRGLGIVRHLTREITTSFNAGRISIRCLCPREESE